ncbi:MAG TPA: hypothetical protein DEP91_13190 [Sphingomonas bacterium]|uniref:AB hydrolase-1 domain-containing protein n=1 Tax=Sphingomonas bacterium TaxID=1895847 RepID=A0A3D0WEY3_9SPHN|nr:hypothetical protein [Sphingomonas bacterium]
MKAALLAAAFFAAPAFAQTAAPPPAAASTAPAPAPTRWPVKEGNYVIRDFAFQSGERLPALRMHYRTLGKPHRDASGAIDNAVMVLHGTGGTGAQFLQPQFADRLYGPGQPLDIARYWIILPDNIGHGESSKPSDGLHMRFPAYDYDDMVDAQVALMTKGLGVAHPRLVFGTSMGCMHGFVMAERHPDFARALMPMACEPVAIAGLNRMWRQLAIDGIKADPVWAGGDYKAQPAAGLRTAASLLFVAGGAPLYLQATYPTRTKASAYAQERVAASIAGLDANDLIYQLDASRNYDPWPRLEAIRTPMTWINSADDFINPRGLPYPAEALKRMPTARFRMIAETPETRGHGTHTWARFWEKDLVELLARTATPAPPPPRSSR